MGGTNALPGADRGPCMSEAGQMPRLAHSLALLIYCGPEAGGCTGGGATSSGGGSTFRGGAIVTGGWTGGGVRGCSGMVLCATNSSVAAFELDVNVANFLATGSAGTRSFAALRPAAGAIGGSGSSDESFCAGAACASFTGAGAGGGS